MGIDFKATRPGNALKNERITVTVCNTLMLLFKFVLVLPMNGGFTVDDDENKR